MRLVMTTVLVLCLAGLAGCNTVKGFGKDVSTAGQKIEKAADH